MAILTIILGIIIWFVFGSMREDWNTTSTKGKLVYILVLVIICILFLICFTNYITNNFISDGGRSWSDLSDVEKENARWAYEAQQAINEYGN